MLEYKLCAFEQWPLIFPIGSFYPIQLMAKAPKWCLNSSPSTSSTQIVFFQTVFVKTVFFQTVFSIGSTPIQLIANALKWIQLILPVFKHHWIRPRIILQYERSPSTELIPGCNTQHPCLRESIKFYGLIIAHSFVRFSASHCWSFFANKPNWTNKQKTSKKVYGLIIAHPLV